jgi:hypothetical protein
MTILGAAIASPALLRHEVEGFALSFKLDIETKHIPSISSLNCQHLLAESVFDTRQSTRGGQKSS